MEERIQKILARRGLGSRREVEEWIRSGRVSVNGRRAQLGDRADPVHDLIRVDRQAVRETAEPLVYYVLNKPRNVVSTLSDPEGRPTVREFLKGVRFRVYPVGRLDFDSEGLMLLTNDGDMTNALLHPSRKVAKVYQVKIQGVLSADEQERFRKGIRLEDGMTLPADLTPIRKTERSSWWEVTLYEGRKRQVRRMFEGLAHRVQRLKRVRMGTLSIGVLKPGEWRPLTPEELERLRSATLPKGGREGRKRGEAARKLPRPSRTGGKGSS